MKKIALLFMALFSVSLMAQTAVIPVYVCPQNGVQAKTSGLLSSNYMQGIVPFCTVNVYLTGTQTIPTTIPQTPFTAKADGSITPIYAATGIGYDVCFSGGFSPNTYSTPVCLTDVFAGGGSGGGGSISGPVGSPVGIGGNFPGTGTTLVPAGGYQTDPALVYGSSAAADMLNNAVRLNIDMLAGAQIGIATVCQAGILHVNGTVFVPTYGAQLVGFGQGSSAVCASTIQFHNDSDGIFVGNAGAPVFGFQLKNLNITGPGSGSGTRVGLHLAKPAVPQAVSSGGTGILPATATLGVTGGALNGTCTVVNPGSGYGSGAGVTWTIVGGGGTQGSATINPTWSNGALASCTVTPGSSSGYTAAAVGVSYDGGAGIIENVNVSGFSQAYVDNYFDQMTVINSGGVNDATNSGLPSCQVTGGTSDDSSFYLRWLCGGKLGSPTASYEIDGTGRGARYFLADVVDTGASPSVAAVIVNGSNSTYYLGDMEGLTAPKMLVEAGQAIVFNSGNQGASLNTVGPLFEVTTGGLMQYHGIAEASATATNSPTFTLSTGSGGGNTLLDNTQYCYVLPGYNSSGHTAYPEQCITTGSSGNTNYVTLTITPLPGITTMVPGQGATGAEQLFSTVSLAGNATTWTDTGALAHAGALPGAATLKYPQFYTDSASDGNLTAEVITPSNGATTMQGMWAKSNGQIYPAPSHVLSYPVSMNASDGSARQTYAVKFNLAASASTNTQLVTVTTGAGNPGNEISMEVTLTAQGPVIGQTVTKYLCVGYASTVVTCYEIATTETPASQKLSLSTATAGTNSYTFYVFNTDGSYGREGVLEVSNLNYGGATIQAVTIGTAANGSPTAAGWSTWGGSVSGAASWPSTPGLPNWQSGTSWGTTYFNTPSANLLNSAVGATTSVTYAGGQDSAAGSTTLGGATLRGANNTGSTGAGVAGSAVVNGGNNASTVTSSQSGSTEIMPGVSTAGGLQGVAIYGQIFKEGTGVFTQWNLVCGDASTGQTADACGASPTNILGVMDTHSGSFIEVHTPPSISPINASGAVTLGDTVCAGTTAGKVTDSGGTTGCTTGITVGVVVSVSGAYTFADGSTAAITTTLPLISMWKVAGIGTGDLPAAVPQVGTPLVNYAACIKSAGPPVVIGYCSSVVGAGGTCTCN